MVLSLRINQNQGQIAVSIFWLIVNILRIQKIFLTNFSRKNTSPINYRDVLSWPRSTEKFENYNSVMRTSVINPYYKKIGSFIETDCVEEPSLTVSF